MGTKIRKATGQALPQPLLGGKSARLIRCLGSTEARTEQQAHTHSAASACHMHSTTHVKRRAH